MTPDLSKWFFSIASSRRSILLAVGALAFFTIFASWVLISRPPGYFLGVDRLRKSEFVFLKPNRTAESFQPQKSLKNGQEDSSGKRNMAQEKSEFAFLSPNQTVESFQLEKYLKNGKEEGSSKRNMAPSNSTMTSTILSSSNSSRKIDSRSCDLYHGKWFYDPSGPLYTNKTCPIITQMENCQGNGRPDKDYENWRWKPAQCDIPQFDAKKFLELVKGKTIAFVGDSLARNQMESLMCMLWQVETPKNKGNARMQRWYFKSASVTIIRIWSSWLVHKTSEPFQFTPKGIVKLHLDVPDEDFMDFLPTFDVLIISSGHWFGKESVYILNNEIVGVRLWKPEKLREKKIDYIEAYRITTETSLSAIVTHPNYTGLTIVRTYTPDHYEGGAWNTGGPCTGKVRPALESEFVANRHTEVMYNKQMMGFKKAIKKTTNKSKMMLMDITKVFGYRPDGHPGPYRSPDPNKVTKRGPLGAPPPQDCLHWCMPGPVDTWNELLLEVLGREFEGN